MIVDSIDTKGLRGEKREWKREQKSKRREHKEKEQEKGKRIGRTDTFTRHDSRHKGIKGEERE